MKEMQWQEEHAFKNNTFNKALEEDEAQFLDAVDAARLNLSRTIQSKWVSVIQMQCGASKSVGRTSRVGGVSKDTAGVEGTRT